MLTWYTLKGDDHISAVGGDWNDFDYTGDPDGATTPLDSHIAAAKRPNSRLISGWAA